MNSNAKGFGVLVIRFVAALLFSSLMMVVGVTWDRMAPAAVSLTLYILPFSIALGLLPLVYWYRRDAYPIGLVFGPVTYFWLLCFARLTGLSY